MGHSASRLLVVVLALAGLGAVPLRAFDEERPSYPASGDVVSAEVKFYISATGKPNPEEYYRIEIATDSKFEEMVVSYDQRKRPDGWILATHFDIKDVPAELVPARYDGVHFRAPKKLADGVYFWRALKAKGTGAYEAISGVRTFSVDTQAPAPIKDLQVERDGSGIRLYWSFVSTDINGNPEQVAGYRVYHFNKPLKRFPLMTRYLEAETDATQWVVPGDKGTQPRITYYLVQAVDLVGNEIGRRRPARVGEFEAAFNPPDLDALTNLDNLRRMNREARRPR